MFPKEMFDAGHKLMVEQAERQRQEEAHNREIWQYFRAGAAIGFLAGAGIASVLFLISVS